MNIALTTDHAGFEAIKLINSYLEALGHLCVNFGPQEFNETDDYPDFMFPAAKAVASGACDFGIILGGSGQGEAMAANRIKGVRCALFYGPIPPKSPIDKEGHLSNDPYESLKLSRSHNNANVLSLGARFLNQDEIEIAISTWLATPFSGLERHERRIVKLDNFDNT